MTDDDIMRWFNTHGSVHFEPNHRNGPYATYASPALPDGNVFAISVDDPLGNGGSRRVMTAVRMVYEAYQRRVSRRTIRIPVLPRA